MLILTILLATSLLPINALNAQVSIDLQSITKVKVELIVVDDIVIGYPNDCTGSWNFCNTINIPCINTDFWQQILDSTKFKEFDVKETCSQLLSGLSHDYAKIDLYFADNDSMHMHAFYYNLGACFLITYQGKEYEAVFTPAIDKRITSYLTELEIKAFSIYDDQRQRKDK